MNEFKRLRRELDMSQRQVATALGVSVSTIQRIEKGIAPTMALLAIKHIAYLNNQVRKGDTIDWVQY